MAMHDSYTVWLPFELATGMEITLPEGTASGNALGYAARLIKRNSRYALELTGVPSADEAAVVLKRLCVGLLWTMLEQMTGIKFSYHPENFEYFDDPVKAGENFAKVFKFSAVEPVDAFIGSQAPAIYLSHKKIVRASGEDITMRLSYGRERFLNFIDQGASLNNFEKVLSDEKLRLAIELYGYSHFQVTPYARFLTLCTALEVIAPTPAVDPKIARQVDQWREQAYKKAEKAKPDSKAREDFTALAFRLGSLKKMSHRQRIKQYINDTLALAKDTDAKIIAKEAVSLYDFRGRIVHDGKINLNGQLTRLDEITRRVLKASVFQV
jgi:hypothetical protein